MRILFISNDLIAGNLAYRLKQEGHDVKLFVEEPLSKECFSGLVEKIEDWKKELDWVGKDGLIVFDDAGYGEMQEKLRNDGYTVFGGCYVGDKLETEREYGQAIFKEYGLKTAPLKNFSSVQDAIAYVKKNGGSWVIKQNNHNFKHLSYVGKFEDGRDIVNVLENYELRNGEIDKITLHKKIEGVEIGVGRYFNGTDWVGPIEYNIEHTKLFPGCIGPTTSEMGTLAWYDDDESGKLFKENLNLLKPFLQHIGYRGDFEVNFIVNETGAYPLEATARLGTPIIHLHDEIHESPWGEFLYAIARGEQYDLKYKKGFGIVVVIATPPFPYSERAYNRLSNNNSYRYNIYFDHEMSAEEMSHIHFEEVAVRATDPKQLYVADSRGNVLYVTGMGQTIQEARDITYEKIKPIVIPKMFYRNDIGVEFEKNSLGKLKEWGYIADGEKSEVAEMNTISEKTIVGI
ncbi:MAG: phosphoribosylglycinamide synthetase C domain-containing protein [Candidatus Paceibacterota bacterium]|jgi:phosphoribosylamine--glycine ligase